MADWEKNRLPEIGGRVPRRNYGPLESVGRMVLRKMDSSKR
jgi:hypothetical protein